MTLFGNLDTVGEFSYFLIYVYEGCARKCDPNSKDIKALGKLGKIKDVDKLRDFRNKLVHYPCDSALIYNALRKVDVVTSARVCAAELGLDIPANIISNGFALFREYHKNNKEVL